jgi:hypothetical protein
MPILAAKVDISGPLAAFENLRRDQLPWVIARTLTALAKDGQAAAQALERQVFRLRNDWIVRNTKITPAQKTRLVAEVLEDTRNRRGKVGDFLDEQETGESRRGFVVVRGGKFAGVYRAIATKYVNPFGNSIPRELMPQNLLDAVNGRYTTYNRKGQIALKNQRLVNGMAFFVQKLTGGALAICGRRPGSQEALPFYILTPSAHLRGIFPLQRKVSEVVQARLEERFKAAAIETIGNDLLRGSGLRIKL